MKVTKLFGLVITVALALTAVSASSAQASPEFHCLKSKTPNCLVKGQSNDVVFTFQGVPVKCTESGGVPGLLVEAVMPETAPSLSLASSSCKAWGVNMGGCKYTLTANPGFNPYPATTDIVCPAGKAISMTLPGSFGCTLTIGAQSGLQGTTLKENFVNGSWVSQIMNVKLSGITYTATGAECPSPGTYSGGAMQGTIELKAFEDGGGGPPGIQRGLRIY